MIKILANKWSAVVLSLLGLGISAPVLGFDIGYGGRLTNQNGEPLGGPTGMVFHFYRSETDNDPLESVNVGDVPLNDGVFQVNIPLLPPQVDRLLGDGSEKIYIQVEAGGQRYPKQIFMYTPLALRVPVDNETLVFHNGTLKVGTISSSQVSGLSALIGPRASSNTPSSLVMRDGSGNFTAGTITANVNGNVSGTASNVTGTVSVANGGTGLTGGTSGGIPFFSSAATLASSGALTSNGIVLGGGVGAAPTATAPLGNGQLLIGSSGSAPVPATLTQGATAGVTISGGAGSLTLDTAQDIRTSATPTFAGLSLGNGSLVAGTLATPLLVAGSQDRSVTPVGGLVRSSDGEGDNITGSSLTIAAGNGTGSGGSGSISFQTASPSTSGSDGNGPNTLETRMTIDQNGNVGIGIILPTSKLDVSGSARVMGGVEVTGTDLQLGTNSGREKGSSTYQRALVHHLSDTLHLNYAGDFEGGTYIGGPSVIVQSGNVGIGTTSPSNKLSVNGNSNFTGNVGIGTTVPDQSLVVAGVIRSSTGGFMFPDGSVLSSALPTPSSGYSSTSDLNFAADLGANGNGQMVMSTRGTERMRITNSGNIGIGSNTPGTKMEVVAGNAANGIRVLSGSSSNWTGYALGRTGTEGILGIAAAPDNFVTGASAGDLILRTESGSQKILFSNGTATPALSIGDGGVLVGGNLGVGVTSPTQSLEVGGIIKSASGGFMFPDGSVMTTAALAGTAGTTSTTDLNLVADSSGTGTGDVIFSSQGSERMRIANGGNVGVGTSAPGDKLMVQSTKDSTVTPQLPGLAVVDSSPSNLGVGGGIAFWGNYAGTTPIAGGAIHAMKNNAAAGDTGFNLAFHTRANGGGLTEKMRITSTGSVGIGTTNPGQALQVNGAITVVGAASSASTNGLVLSDEGPFKRIQSFNNEPLYINPIANNVVLNSNIGNVGIGTTNPSQKLDVTGVVRASGGFMFADGTVMTTATTGSSSSTGSTSSNTDLVLAADADATGDGSVLVQTSGIERVRVSNSGNVGIGTTLPTGALHVNRGISDTLGDGFLVFSNSNPLFAWRHPASSNRLVLDRWFGGTWSEALTVDRGTGNVGIGTTAPTYRLHVYNATSSTMALGQSTHGLYLGADANLPWMGTFTNSGLRLVTNGTEKMRIDPGGSVGIGTISPTNRLSVAGGANFTGNVGIGSALPTQALDVAGVIRSSVGGIMFPDGSTMTTAATAGTGTSSTTDLNFAADSDTNGSGVITFATSGSERMRVGNTGNIGFGTSTPLSRVSVNGGLAVGSYAGTTAAPSDGMIVSGNVGIGTSSPGALLHVNGNIQLGKFNTSAGSRYVGLASNNDAFGVDGMSGMEIESFTDNGNYSQKLHFWTHDYAALTGSRQLTISETGNIGIGSISPTNKLSVNGSADFTGNIGIGTATPSQALDVAGNIKLSSASGALIFPDGTSMTTAAAASTGSASTTDLALASDSDGNGSGAITLGTSGTERMRVDTTGNIGIGTTAPTSLLTLRTTSIIDGINLVGNSAGPSSPAYSLYDGALERGVFGFAAAAGHWSTSASAGDVVLKATSGKLLFQSGTAGAGMTLSGSNVGIGTTAPTALLHLRGSGADSSTYNSLRLDNPAAGNTAGTTNGLLFYWNGMEAAKVASVLEAAGSPWPTSLAFYTAPNSSGATEKMRINSAGNVGIGSAAPTQRLDVAGAIRSSSGGFIFPDGTVMTTAITSTTAGTSSSTDLNLAADSEATGNGSIILSTRTIERMRILNSGNVGIGTSTPAGLLDVNGALLVTAGGNVGIGTTVPRGRLSLGTVAEEKITLVENATAASRMGLGIATNDFRSFIGTTANFFTFRQGGYSGTELMRITGVGNVGIGTASPGNKLSVNGMANVTGRIGIGTASPVAPLDVYGATNSEVSARIVNANSGTSAYSSLRLGNDSVDHFILFMNSSTRSTDGGANTATIRNHAGDLRLQSSGNNGMVIAATSGNIGIGSTTPGSKLDVVGDINTSTCVRVGGTQQLGTCASDERFKKNIRPIKGALAKLRLLSPVHYEFRTEEFPDYRFSPSVESGLIAQEVEQVFPELVKTGEDGYKRVTYGLGLEMHTIAAVKELALENERLRERLDLAEGEVARLKAAAAALKAESDELRAFLCGEFPTASICKSQ